MDKRNVGLVYFVASNVLPKCGACIFCKFVMFDKVYEKKSSTISRKT
jgi:hypothetical protein